MGHAPPTGADSARLDSSFRDPSGHLFRREGVLYRQVSPSYRGDYDQLVASGLLRELTAAGRLVAHDEVDPGAVDAAGAYKVLRPELVPFVSWPYEWCFSQLRDAALLTLEIQQAALRRGMILKDASAYNVQFLRGRPVLIDTLSFERQQPGQPWPAYRQFCQHFLAPLALMAQRDVRLSQLLRVYIDGVPLDLASALLPRRTWWRPSLFSHIHLHARGQRYYASRGEAERGAAPAKPRAQFGRLRFEALIESLKSAVARLSWRPAGTEWASYYDQTNYTDDSFGEKKRLVEAFLDQARPGLVWDLGANRGVFSRLASDRGILTVAADVDPAAVEQNYRQVREKNEQWLLPLVVDLTNPSPALGWRNRERPSLLERGPADAVLALALIHHLAISNNVPLADCARFFAAAGRWLTIEFVPKEDSQVRRLLATREDIFPDYTEAGFRAAFERHFAIEERREIPGSNRVLYLMRAHPR